MASRHVSVPQDQGTPGPSIPSTSWEYHCHPLPGEDASTSWFTFLSCSTSPWVMGLTPALLLCTQEPWLCFVLLEVLLIYSEPRIYGKIQTLHKLPLPKPLLYIQAIMTGICQEQRIQRSPSATCLLMAVLAKSTTCSTYDCEIQPGRSVWPS